MADNAVHTEQTRLVFWTKPKLPQKNSIVPGVIDSGNMYPHVSEGLTNKVKAVMPVVQWTVEDVNSQSPRTQSLGSSSMSQHVSDTAMCKQITTAGGQGVSVRNLCVEDKKPVANLIKEPASLSRDCHRSREENDNEENNLTAAWKRLGDQILLAKARREQWLRRSKESSEKDSLVPGVNHLGNMQPCVSGGRTKEIKAVMPDLQSTVEDVNAQSPRTQSLGSSSMSQHVSDSAMCKQITTASGQGVSLRNLCVEDKKPVTNLIKEPASLSRDCHRSREENDNAENDLTVKMKRLDDQIQLVLIQQKQWLKSIKDLSEKDSLAPGVNHLGNMQPCVSGGRTKEIKAVMPVVQSTVEDVNAQSPRTQSLGRSSMSQHVSDSAMCKQITTASGQGVSMRNLCVEDKKPVANLIKEPASLSRDCHRSREENDNEENNLTAAWKRLGDQILLAKARREQWLRRSKESSEKDSLAPGVNDHGNMQPCVSGGRTKEIKAVLPVVQSTVEDVNSQSPRTQSLGSSSMSQHVSDSAMCKSITTASGHGVSLRNLCMEDKKPVANLVKEPASLSRDCQRSREENDNAENDLTVKMKRLDDQIQLVVTHQEQWLKAIKGISSEVTRRHH